MSHIGTSQVLPFIEAAVEARTEIVPALAGNRWGCRCSRGHPPGRMGFLGGRVNVAEGFLAGNRWGCRCSRGRPPGGGGGGGGVSES
jgi:hypothetical protein